MGFRRELENLSRGIVLQRRLSKEHGGARLYVSPEIGGLRYWKPSLVNIDRALLGFVERHVHEGCKLFDIGANVGLLAFAAAHRAGPSGAVVAVEADVEAASLLFRSRRELDPKTNAPVTIVAAAVTRPDVRFLRFAISNRSRRANAIEGHGSTQMGGVRELRDVVAITLDELVQETTTPDVVKIDVEGAELDVLAGASRLLASRRPILHIEVFREHAERAGRLLRDLGYSFYNADLYAHGELGPPVDLPPDSCLALPPPGFGPGAPKP